MMYSDPVLLTVAVMGAVIGFFFGVATRLDEEVLRARREIEAEFRAKAPRHWWKA